MAVEIHRGADSLLSIRVLDTTGKPYDLTGYSLITVELPNCVQGSFSIDSTPIPAVPATATYESVVFTATTGGVDGNLISLVFDGVDDIDTVISDWNAANVGNEVGFSSDTIAGTDVLPAGTVNLLGGVDSFEKIKNVDPRLGEFDLKLISQDSNQLRVGQNQAMVVHIDKNGTHPDSDRETVVNEDAITVKPSPF